MNKRNLIASAALVALNWSAAAAAQDAGDGGAAVESEDREPPVLLDRSRQILVVASRGVEVGVDAYTGSQLRISTAQIGQRQVRDVADVLRDVPGAAVASVAGQTQLRIRGSEANHVLVLVDGIEVSDPFAGEFDLGTLQAGIGSSIEVLRGPQSAIYGSDAIGGVVSYRSANGVEAPGASAWLEGGSNNTINGSASLGLGNYSRNLALGATFVSSDGEPNARGGSRDIGRNSYTVSGKGEVNMTENLSLRAAARLVRTEGDFNDTDFDLASPSFGLVIDTPGTRYVNEAFYALAGARFETFNGDWTHDLSAQIADNARDTFGSFGRTSGSDGDRLKASYVSAAAFSDGNQTHFVTFAADWERERFRNDDPFDFAFTGRRKIENIGLVGEYRFEGRSVDVSAAVRHDFNDRFADETTFRFGAGFDLSDESRVRAAYGTGIKNPGFFELFGFFDGRFIGNKDLKPEKSESWEVGIDQRLASGAVTLSATYFDSQLEGEIFTTFPAPTFVATPANRGTLSRQRGIEVSARAQLGPRLSLDAAYSWLDAKEDGVDEVRRPGNIASAVLTWTAPDGAGSATLIVRHNGATDDVAFTDPSFIPVLERLESYTLVNFNAEARLTDRLRLFGRVENLLDERYEQVFSFVSPGRSLIAGLRIAL